MPTQQHRSPFAWPGGKRLLTKRLLPLIPAHLNYVEVFAGSAKLLFAKTPSKREVINDVNGDLVNFFRVAKHRPAALAEWFEHEIIAAERFRNLHGSQPEDELTRAGRFAYLTWYSFGSKGQHFASSTERSCRSTAIKSLDRVSGLLDQVATRLKSVLIEQRDFADILERYDGPDTWFYLDPPYVRFGGNGRYEALTEARRVELFKILAALKGKFLLSFDDCPEIRTAVQRHKFRMLAVTVSYTMGSTHASRGARNPELLVSNYALEEMS